jgi:hypothetical protein
MQVETARFIETVLYASDGAHGKHEYKEEHRRLVSLLLQPIDRGRNRTQLLPVWPRSGPSGVPHA